MTDGHIRARFHTLAPETLLLSAQFGFISVGFIFSFLLILLLTLPISKKKNMFLRYLDVLASWANELASVELFSFHNRVQNVNDLILLQMTRSAVKHARNSLIGPVVFSICRNFMSKVSVKMANCCSFLFMDFDSPPFILLSSLMCMNVFAFVVDHVYSMIITNITH